MWGLMSIVILTIFTEIIGKGNDTETEKVYFTEGRQSGLPEIKYEY